MKQKKILAVETCTTICSVALWDGNQMHEQVVETERSHSKKILPMCEALLSQAQLTMQELDAIACTRGPGSFTGLRIGLGVAKGLAFGQDLPVYALSSLEVLAYRVIQETQSDRVVSLLDARMGELYCGEYGNRDGLPCLQGKERLITIEQLSIGSQIFAGTGVKEYMDNLESRGAILSDVLYPMARDVINLALNEQVEPVTASELNPVYLRDKVTD